MTRCGSSSCLECGPRSQAGWPSTRCGSWFCLAWRSLATGPPRCARADGIVSLCGWRKNWSVQVVAQDLGAGRVAELGHGLGLDLPDPLPGDPVDLADLVQGLGLPVGQAEPHRDHARLTLGQRVQNRVQLLLEQREADRLAGLDGFGVLDQVAELAVAVLAERGVQRNRLTAVLLHLD